MTTRRSLDPQFDLFVPYISDLPLRDQRETMERPFFSLGKRKRLKPIEYVSPNGEVFVNVFPNAEFGMATIWDADILIWAASHMNSLRKQGRNDLPRTLTFQPYDLLKTIGRLTGGHQYQLLRESLGRLQATSIVTNIRVPKGKKQRQFSWIESWTDNVDGETQQSRGMGLTLSDWFYEGILMDGGLLSIDPVYFTITGGRERWMYRVARKHAGGAGEGGFAISLPTLFQKSGAEREYRRFKFEMLAIVRKNDLPGFDLSLEPTGKEPSLRMSRRTTDVPGQGRAARPKAAATVAASAQPACADITYIPMAKGFVYLVAVMDWFSRRVLAWRVSITLETDFCVDAMNRHGQPEIFNTDQGVQFTSAAFLGELETLGVRNSMDGKGPFLDNFFIERLWRSLKYEEVFIKAYGSVPGARIGIGEWLRFYNDKRPH